MSWRISRHGRSHTENPLRIHWIGHIECDFKLNKFARTFRIQEDDGLEVQMIRESKSVRQAAAKAVQGASLPTVVGRGEFEAQLDQLRIREKEHTHHGDAIAADRRRLPMVEVNASTTLMGANGPVTLLDTFEGRQQLIAYYFMWHKGHPAQEQCQGCTWVTGHLGELSYFHARDVTFAVFAQGPYEESARYAGVPPRETG